VTRQENKIYRIRDEHANNYMTDTEYKGNNKITELRLHSLPSIVDNIKPKVHRIVNIFLRLYDFIQNEWVAMA